MVGIHLIIIICHFVVNHFKFILYLFIMILFTVHFLFIKHLLSITIPIINLINFLIIINSTVIIPINDPFIESLFIIIVIIQFNSKTVLDFLI